MGMQGMGVRMRGIRVEMRGMQGMQGIKVRMWGTKVGMQVYKHLTDILQGCY